MITITAINSRIRALRTFPADLRHLLSAGFQRSKLAGATGFEPVAFGFGVGDPGHPAESEASRSLTLRTVTSSAASPNFSPRPADQGQFAALVLHGSRPLVSPKEAALRLGIKLSTVYRLCAKRALPHVRLGSLLRIDVERYLATPGNWNRKP